MEDVQLSHMLLKWRLELCSTMDRLWRKGSLPSRVLGRTTQRLVCVCTYGGLVDRMLAFTWVLTAPQRGTVGGKDGLSLDLNDSTPLREVDQSYIQFHVTSGQEGQQREAGSEHEQCRVQDEAACCTWKHMSCYLPAPGIVEYGNKTKGLSTCPEITVAKWSPIAGKLRHEYWLWPGWTRCPDLLPSTMSAVSVISLPAAARPAAAQRAKPLLRASNDPKRLGSYVKHIGDVRDPACTVVQGNTHDSGDSQPMPKRLLAQAR